MLSFSDLSDRHAQLRQVVGRLALKTLVYHPTELVRDPICHIEPVQLSVKELRQTAVVLPLQETQLSLRSRATHSCKCNGVAGPLEHALNVLP